ncbi:MAG: 50S ribosomal protein L5 [candidate division BRC1 bacterium ADurb.BinA292]|nr:MAG: 50S ribosomal protein L5 [candidate division BRC1 bacterium ADurb.BinA292]
MMSDKATQNGYRPRLLAEYQERIRPSLMDELKLKNVMEVPRLLKVVLNMGVGEGSRDEKILQAAEEDLALISGQKPRRTRAKISVAAFKLRAGMPVGCMVTLRGPYMYEFLERLINVAIPRIRDFRGLPPRAFDGKGNYNFGIREHTIFTEIDHRQVQQTFGMNITLVTNAKSDDHCRTLLRRFGLPLREN